MAENLKILDAMNEFDESEPLRSTFNSKNLEEISKGLNSSSEEEYQQALNQMPAKLKNLVKMVKRTVEKLNATLTSKFPNMRPIELENSISFNASGLTGKFELFEVGNSQHISFNAKSLSKLPAFEASAIITKSVVDALAKQNKQENSKNFYGAILLSIQDDSSPKTKEEKDVLKAKNIIAGYLRNYLPAVYADDFDKFVAISDYIAKQIIEEMGESDIEKILSNFFDLEQLNINEIADEKVDKFLGKTHTARLSYLNNKATNLALDPEKDILSLGYLEQVQSLLETNSAGSNYVDVSRKFETLSSGEKCLTGKAVEEFCLGYVHNFLSGHNVADIDVTFENKGELGTFYDSSNSININLSKLKKIGSYTELAMTLSHELTHAVDSARNKVAGEDGLINDISEKYKSSSNDPDVRKLMKNLKILSYHINPNEKNARIGEISALLFMSEVGAKDPAIKQEISASAKSYISYQKNTVNIIKSLPNKLVEYKGQFETFVNNGVIPKNSKLYYEISERFEYIERFGLGASVEREIKSIEDAEKILKGENLIKQNQEAENARKIAEEKKKEEFLEEMQGKQM